MINVFNNDSSLTDQRLVSVDALRGFVMIWIISGTEVLINHAKATGNIFFEKIMPVTFDHHWGQFYFYDLIMLMFLFVVGIVMPVSW